MFTREQVKAIIAQVSNPDLAKQHGGVIQVWEDGEITYQKSGDLLWQRTLHCFSSGLSKSVPLDWMTQDGESPHAYIFCTREDAEIVRRMIQEME